MKLIEIDPVKSPYPNSAYIAELQLSSSSEILTWQDVTVLHETAREITKSQRFSWWCSLPPELWLVPQIAYVFPAPTAESLPNTAALRIDIKEGYQFSTECRALLTLQQLISLRKYAFRIRSDFRMYVEKGAYCI